MEEHEGMEPLNYPIAPPAQETRAVLQLPPSMIPFPVPSPVLGLAPPGAAFWNAVLEAQKAARRLEKVHEGPLNKQAGKVYERVNRNTGEVQLGYPPMFTYVSAEQYIEELRRVCHPQGLVVIQVGCLGEQSLRGTRDRMASGFVIVHAATASGGLVPFEFPMTAKKIDAAAENAYTKAWSYFVRGFLQIPRADPRDEGVYDAPEQYAQGWDGHYAQQPPVEQLVVPVQNQQAQQPVEQLVVPVQNQQAQQPVEQLVVPVQNQQAQQPVQQNQRQPAQQGWQQPQQQDWQQQPFPQEEQQQDWQQQPQQDWPQDQQQGWQQPQHEGWQQPQAPQENWQQPPQENWQQPPQENWQQPPQESWQQPPQESWQQPAQQRPDGQNGWQGDQGPGEPPQSRLPIEEEPLVKEAKDLLQADLAKHERVGEPPTNGHGPQSAQGAEPRTPDEWRRALVARGWKDEIAMQLVATNLNEPISPGLREEIASLALTYYHNNPEAIRVAWQGTGFEPNPSLPPAIRPRPTGLHVLRYALKMIHNNHQQPAAAQ